MANFFIKRPIFAIVMSIIIVLGGLIAMYNLPVGQYPQITPPQINVSASYNGANAQTVEQSIAQVIETQVNGVEGAVAMQSTSTDNGSYTLTVKFELGKDGDMAATQTQNQVGWANAQLPSDVLNAGVVTKKQAPDTVMFFTLFSPNDSYDRAFVKNYGSINIVDALKRVKGVGKSNRNKYGCQHSGNGHNRAGYIVHSLNRSIPRRHTGIAHVMLNRFHHHNRIIDDQPDSQYHRK